MTVAAASNLANMPPWPPHSSPDASEAAAGGEAAAKYHQLSGVRARVSGGQTTAGAGARRHGGKQTEGTLPLPGRRRMKLVVDVEYPSNQHHSLIFVHSLCPRRSKTNEVILI